MQECLLELHYISAAEKSWQSWCSASEAQRDAIRAGAAGESSDVPEVHWTQFWTISALRIFAAAEPPSGLPSSAQHLPGFQVFSIQISRTVPFLRITNSNDFVFCPLNLRCSWSLCLTAVVRIKVDIFDVCLPVSWLSGALVLIQLRAYFAMKSIIQ